MPASTINEVIDALQTIITDSIAASSRVGYFAALYYKVTAAVRDGITKGQFENGPRMEKFDVIFANRYLDALSAWKNKQPMSDSWRVAFETAERSSPLVLQQLLLGMNAHINLDLGIAAVEVSNGNMDGVQKDFDAINTIISALTYQVISEINRVSPLLSLLGLHSSNYSIIIQFSIGNARDGAWCFAEDLLAKQGTAYADCITARDKTIAQLAQGLAHATGLMRITLWLIHVFEWKSPSKIIRELHEYQKEKIVVNTPSAIPA
ncbi:hypothetical protein G7092_10010 [Mucilaginibacter sp. HC2]|uniref:DUF5995 family protein n=1 Tax=Mucilaginibacter inviolabilis TaxID=2714892 RepID=UPI00140AE320|nr:DUF5995 family protein [Mucilaginibacter inviolabilis]NHA04130.1 hypothetical protein [Mucilaginibacter inviolabilis]